VPAPPAATTVALPAELRSGFISALEPVFTAVMLASFLLHSAAAIFVKVVEPPAPVDSLEDLRRVVENLAPPPKVDVPKVPLPVDTTVTTGPGKGDDEPKPKGDGDGDAGGDTGAKKGKGGGGGGVGDRAALREQIAGRGILQLIGGRGGDGSGGGAVGSVFGAGSSISDDIGSALAGTAGVGVAGAGGGGVTRRGTGGDGTGGDGSGGGLGGGAADIGVLATGGGGKVDTGQKSAARIVARVRADDVEAVDGKIDRKVVKATLQRRADAFQACYEQALKANSKLQGKLVVEFTIGDAGKVIEARIVKDGLGNGAVNQCVLEVLRRLRFPAPDDGEVTISNTFVFQPGS
jgi:TonB family protein